MYLTKYVFDYPLAKYARTINLPETDPCEALSDRRKYSSFGQVIDSIERPVVPAPRARPALSAEQREVSELVEPISHCAAVYPEAAAAAKLEGWVRIEFVVSADGTPNRPRVIDSSPPGVFETAALAAISKCRFKPLIIDGETVHIEGALFSVSFEL